MLVAVKGRDSKNLLLSESRWSGFCLTDTTPLSLSLVFEFSLGFWESLVGHLRLNPAALAPPLRRDYLHVLDYLRALPSNELVVTSIATWESFLEVGGFTELELREEAAAERKRAMGDAKGCGWYKCAVFGLDFPGGSYLRCAACLDTLYCGLLCQRRWVFVC